MAVCVIDSGTNIIVSSTPVDSCVDYVMFTATEYATMHPAMPPEDVAAVAFSVVAVWAVAWGFKVLRKTL